MKRSGAGEEVASNQMTTLPLPLILSIRGAVDNQKEGINDSAELQACLLPRLLETTLEGADEFGLCGWKLTGARRPASPQLRAKLQDATLELGGAMRLIRHWVSAGNVLLWEDGAGGIVLHVPAWWREEQGKVLCLH